MATITSLGINYGQVVDNLPSLAEVVTLLTLLNLTKTHIYDTNPQVLSAFPNSGIKVIVIVPNEMIPSLKDPQQALQWDLTNITGITAGNEVFTGGNNPLLMSSLVEAMTNIHDSLTCLGLASCIHISSANLLSLLDDPVRVSLDYALFDPNPGMGDPDSRLHCDNMLYVQVNAVVVWIGKLGFGDVEVRVSETGWPSKGDLHEVETTVENAKTYNKN
ncbi:Glucan endo-1,3-beta-glucosidase 11 [Acorus calamus]|uniref:Glucan endo-1,3-beta-glucosidase 11 n=1 Tax=Acorus calamus TaxID=4465 RepID=A0AAV9FKT8_ACOCL|nr:Glucan endo-1,3-beta-glucosidase 11 [Acorus calamus]